MANHPPITPEPTLMEFGEILELVGELRAAKEQWRLTIATAFLFCARPVQFYGSHINGKWELWDPEHQPSGHILLPGLPTEYFIIEKRQLESLLK